VIYAGAEVVFYALAAAASALVLAATLVVIRSERPRTNGIAFLSGFVFGTVIACGLGLALGQAAVDRIESHETLRALFTLALGVALLAVGLQSRRAVPSRPEARSSRAAAIINGLGQVGPAASFSMAGLLGFGGPKRLVLTCLAMAAVADAGVRDVLEVPLVLVYVAVSTTFVSVPVGIVVIAGDRASLILARAQSWVSEHAAALRTWLSCVVGGALVVDGLVRLLV
jgi:Sap, sulfolipid-1-addressing protein